MLVALAQSVFLLVSLAVLGYLAYETYCAYRYGNHFAPKGKVYVCQTCGKMSRDKHGEHAISTGWDDTCSLDAVLYSEDTLIVLGGRAFNVFGDKFRGKRGMENHEEQEL